MRRFSWIITVPITIVIVVFSIANRQPVTIDLWPFEFDEPLRLPLFLLVLGALLVGFCIGAAVMWISDGRVRNRARENYYKASHLQREVAALKRKQEPSAAPGGANLPVAHQKT